MDTFEFRASPFGELNTTAARRVPDNAPIGFIRRRWQPYVFEAEGINRRFYELCVLSEMSNAVRSGDLWVVGRQPTDWARRVSYQTFSSSKGGSRPKRSKTLLPKKLWI